VCTWNLHGALPPQPDVQQLLRPEIEHEVYAIGTEECQRSIPASFFKTSKDAWETLLTYLHIRIGIAGRCWGRSTPSFVPIP